MISDYPGRTMKTECVRERRERERERKRERVEERKYAGPFIHAFIHVFKYLDAGNSSVLRCS